MTIPINSISNCIASTSFDQTAAFVIGTASNDAAVISMKTVIAAVIVFVISHAVYDHIIYHVRRTRLIRLLVFDCAATVNKLSIVLKQIDRTIELSCNAKDEFECVRDLHSGFPMSGPIVESRDLMRNLQPMPASLLGRYFDRWTRLQEIEKRYSRAHEKLVEAVAKAKTDPSPDYYNLVKEEYWSQVRDDLKLMRRLSIHLCHFSCELFRGVFSATDLGRNFALIQDHSNGRWKNWKDFDADAEKFKSLFAAT